MKILVGAFLILLAVVLALACVHVAQLALTQLTHASELSSFGWGQTTGRVFAVFLFGLLAVKSFRAGLKRFGRPIVASRSV